MSWDTTPSNTSEKASQSTKQPNRISDIIQKYGRTVAIVWVLGMWAYQHSKDQETLQNAVETRQDSYTQAEVQAWEWGYDVLWRTIDPSSYTDAQKRIIESYVVQINSPTSLSNLRIGQIIFIPSQEDIDVYLKEKESEIQFYQANPHLKR